MDTGIASFASVVINPNEIVKVSVCESLWCISSISLVIKDDLPSEGRVVVYAAPVNEDGSFGDKIAIAPLRVNSYEVASVDFEINSTSPIVFTTSGANIAVSVNGFTTTPAPLKVEMISQ